jgi:hypothetical protein
MHNSACEEQLEVTTHPSSLFKSDRVAIDNNLFAVKRLIQRIDLRNPDPAMKRYTSLAWAAVLSHEETFEFLLSAGHDDEELSKVGRDIHVLYHPNTELESRIPKTTRYSCCWLTQGQLWRAPTLRHQATPTLWAQYYV